MTLISTARAVFSTKSSPFTLISTIYLPREVLLHTFGRPHYIRQFKKSSALICEMLASFNLQALTTSRIAEMSVSIFIFANFETPRRQFCTKLPEKSDLFYLGKTRLPQI